MLPLAIVLVLSAPAAVPPGGGGDAYEVLDAPAVSQRVDGAAPARTPCVACGWCCTPVSRLACGACSSVACGAGSWAWSTALRCGLFAAAAQACIMCAFAAI